MAIRRTSNPTQSPTVSAPPARTAGADLLPGTAVGSDQFVVAGAASAEPKFEEVVVEAGVKIGREAGSEPAGTSVLTNFWQLRPEVSGWRKLVPMCTYRPGGGRSMPVGVAEEVKACASTATWKVFGEQRFGSNLIARVQADFNPDKPLVVLEFGRASELGGVLEGTRVLQVWMLSSRAEVFRSSFAAPAPLGRDPAGIDGGLPTNDQAFIWNGAVP